MDSNDITTDQARQIRKSLYPLANYLVRLVERMERRGFLPNDPLYMKARDAYNEMHSLTVELHYMSCESGVEPPRPKPLVAGDVSTPSQQKVGWIITTPIARHGTHWMTAPDADGKRTLSRRREDAGTFETRRDAQDVIETVDRNELPPHLATIDFYIVQDSAGPL